MWEYVTAPPVDMSILNLWLPITCVASVESVNTAVPSLSLVAIWTSSGDWTPNATKSV